MPKSAHARKSSGSRNAVKTRRSKPTLTWWEYCTARAYAQLRELARERPLTPSETRSLYRLHEAVKRYEAREKLAMPEAGA